jgi:hypothetical protein
MRTMPIYKSKVLGLLPNLEILVKRKNFSFFWLGVEEPEGRTWNLTGQKGISL